MHRRDDTALGRVLAILERGDQPRDIFKKLYNLCGLSGVVAEDLYKSGKPGQYHRTGEESFRPPLFPSVNQWKTPLPWVKSQPTKKTNTRESPPLSSRHVGTTVSALAEGINTIMSILHVVRSAEVANLAAKFRKAKHDVDRRESSWKTRNSLINYKIL
ncbi:hypothetical protein EVAR_48272_1 [Eumeta japonica]|uniref:Uncharacterized protein n=1 Tax=Eumeta variegata TaxID=151549 RepID=A0A4C1Y5W1_EUMVA|nr:hypothetical protein EVAR_48272_1 [Eumeta japonica]